MKWQLFVVISCALSASAEPLIFSTLMSIRQVTNASDSLVNNLMRIREKTAALNEDIEKIAPAGVVGKLASSVISSTSNVTASVINTVTQAIDETANDAAAWVRNVSLRYFEKGVDFVLNKFQTYVLSHHMDKLALPPIDTKISGVHVVASGGYFSSFASLRKEKNITVTTQGDEGIGIQTRLTFSVLNTGYTKFTAKFFFMSMSGSFQVLVQKNEIDVFLRLKAVDTCALNVDRVDVTAMDGISFKFQTGCNYCSSLIGRVSSGLANFLKKTLIKHVQDGIKKGIQRVLKSDKLICAHFVESA